MKNQHLDGIIKTTNQGEAQKAHVKRNEAEKSTTWAWYRTTSQDEQQKSTKNRSDAKDILFGKKKIYPNNRT